MKSMRQKIEEMKNLRVVPLKEPTGLYDCNGNQLYLNDRVITGTEEEGVVVWHEGKYRIKLDPKYVLINRMCELIKKRN